MRKLLIPVVAIATLFQAACSGDPVVNRLPWVYRIEIQQGNVISQEAVSQLRLGMNKRQVQFVLGTPLLVDPFHADRWDYYYQYKPGSDGEEQADKQRLSLFFEGDSLVRIDGSVLPQPAGEASESPRQVTVNVPPQEIEDPGVLTRLWRWFGFGAGDEYGATPTTTNRETGAPAPQVPPVY
ncbi:MAG: outer membrane protein assembly factor BamE [Gammaproteobacteria bacterium]|jgi:outer membrane protein assembly factor BamE